MFGQHVTTPVDRRPEGVARQEPGYPFGQVEPAQPASEQCGRRVKNLAVWRRLLFTQGGDQLGVQARVDPVLSIHEFFHVGRLVQRSEPRQNN